jgi:hypothetical protein
MTSERVPHLGEAARAPGVADLDPRLVAGAGRIALLTVIAEHDTPAGARCPACGWRVGARGQRACPSRAMARAICDRRPVPGWLLHLVDDVPGARAPAAPVALEQRWTDEDALPGLFDAPPRQPSAAAPTWRRFR